jgi:hypothetical protein
VYNKTSERQAKNKNPANIPAIKRLAPLIPKVLEDSMINRLLGPGVIEVTVI